MVWSFLDQHLCFKCLSIGPRASGGPRACSTHPWKKKGKKNRGKEKKRKKEEKKEREKKKKRKKKKEKKKKKQKR